jgi:16S rRNA (adenine1518-N6/adenine1519-N6)-dimethyltransferase
VSLKFGVDRAWRSDPLTFAEVVHAAFGTRRKMLRGSLGRLVERAGLAADGLKAETGIDLRRRGESLSVEEFDALAAALRPAGRPERPGKGCR